MARVLVMIPSGEVYDHDCVRWYNYQDVQKSINHYHNIGDAFVFDSRFLIMLLNNSSTKASMSSSSTCRNSTSKFS